MKALFMSRIVFVSLLTVVVLGCVSERPLSKEEVDVFVAKINEYQRQRVTQDKELRTFVPQEEFRLRDTTLPEVEEQKRDSGGIFNLSRRF